MDVLQRVVRILPFSWGRKDQVNGLGAVIAEHLLCSRQ